GPADDRTDQGQGTGGGPVAADPVRLRPPLLGPTLGSHAAVGDAHGRDAGGLFSFRASAAGTAARRAAVPVRPPPARVVRRRRAPVASVRPPAPRVAGRK